MERDTVWWFLLIDAVSLCIAFCLAEEGESQLPSGTVCPDDHCGGQMLLTNVRNAALCVGHRTAVPFWRHRGLCNEVVPFSG